MTLHGININELIDQVVKKKVEITINLAPDSAEIQIYPWKPFEYKCPYVTETK